MDELETDILSAHGDARHEVTSYPTNISKIVKYLQKHRYLSNGKRKVIAKDIIKILTQRNDDAGTDA